MISDAKDCDEGHEMLGKVLGIDLGWEPGQDSPQMVCESRAVNEGQE